MFQLEHPGAGRLNALAISPDGSRLAACGDRGEVQVWDLASRSLVMRRRAGRRSVDGVFFGPDSETVYALTRPSRLLALPRGGRSWVDVSRQREVLFACTDPRGRAFCALEVGESVGLYRLDDLTGSWARARIEGPRDLAGGVVALACSPDGLYLGCAHVHGQVSILDTQTGATVHSYASGATSFLTGLAVAPGGTAAACIASSVLLFHRLPAEGEPVRHRIGATHFLGIAWHPSGGFFATVKGDGTVDFWDGLTGQRRESLDWKTGKLLDIAFDPAGDRAAVCAESGKVVVWDVDR